MSKTECLSIKGGGELTDIIGDRRRGESGEGSGESNEGFWASVWNNFKEFV